MAGEPETDPLDSVEAQALRSQYRCTMCHKRCPVPCRFTGAEFRELAATWRDGGNRPEVIATAGWDETPGTGKH
jgi:epoxyqueuosine reductase QueG